MIQSHWFSLSSTGEKLGAILMVLWWPNTGGHMRAAFLAIFKSVAWNTALSIHGKLRGREMKLGASTLRPSLPLLSLRMPSLRCGWGAWSYQNNTLGAIKNIWLMKDINRGLCQVVTPGIMFSLIIYTDMPEGNATKTEQQFTDSPAGGPARGPGPSPRSGCQPRQGLVWGVEWLCWYCPQNQEAVAGLVCFLPDVRQSTVRSTAQPTKMISLHHRFM